MSEVRIKFLDRVVVDNVYENAVDRYQARARRRNAIIFLVIVAIAIGIIVWRVTT